MGCAAEASLGDRLPASERGKADGVFDDGLCGVRAEATADGVLLDLRMPVGGECVTVGAPFFARRDDGVLTLDGLDLFEGSGHDADAERFTETHPIAGVRSYLVLQRGGAEVRGLIVDADEDGGIEPVSVRLLRFSSTDSTDATSYHANGRQLVVAEARVVGRGIDEAGRTTFIDLWLADRWEPVHYEAGLPDWL